MVNGSDNAMKYHILNILKRNLFLLIFTISFAVCCFVWWTLLCVLKHLNGSRIWHKLQVVIHITSYNICSAHYAQLGEQLIIWWHVGMQILYDYNHKNHINMNSFIWLHNYRKSFISLYDFMNIFIWLYDHLWWWPCVWEMQTPPCSWDETIAPSTVLPFMPIISKPITHASNSQWQGYKYTYLYLYLY